jgi:SAM-dependent methyltransferase
MPISYRAFAAAGIFRHGHMRNPDYAIDVFLRHFERSGISATGQPFVGLELGVGDSVASAIVARAHGASTCYLIDSGRFAAEDRDTYGSTVKALHKRGIQIDDLENATTLDEILAKYGGVYATEGLRSLQTIPSSSIDFAWSQAVLEHIRVHEFDLTMKELHRISRPGGVLSHRVDLKDHLGGALNNMRLPGRLWEAEWMAQSGFYTNRIKFKDMIHRFEQAGFEVNVIHIDRWEVLPTPRRKMAAEFATIPEDDLLVSGFDVLLTR